MEYRWASYYDSPLGEILIAGVDEGVAGLWFADQDRGIPAELKGLRGTEMSRCMDMNEMAKAWLDVYFSGRNPGTPPPVVLTGTKFQMEVWEILKDIPYGETVTYGEIARELAARSGIGRMSAQAVGGAVGRNPVSIIVPCHRVVGAGGRLTGYAGGLERKKWLLGLERKGLKL